MHRAWGEDAGSEEGWQTHVLGSRRDRRAVPPSKQRTAGGRGSTPQRSCSGCCTSVPSCWQQLCSVCCRRRTILGRPCGRPSWAVASCCSPPVPPLGPPVCSVCEPTIAPVLYRLLQGEAGDASRDGKAVRVQGGTAAPAGQAAERAPERPRRHHEGALPALRCAARAATCVSLVGGSTAAPTCHVCGGYAGCGSMEAGHIARSLGRGSVVADSNSTAIGCPRLLMMRGSIHCGLPGAGD